MNNRRDITRKLRAWEAGQPIARYATLHHELVDPQRVLVVAFVRMAGESRPWGIAWGPIGAAPRIESVPDGRVRDDVAVMCAEFAEELLGHLRVHNWTYDPAGKDDTRDQFRQVWLANGQHVGMLHQMSYTYSQTRFGGTNQEILRAFGRLAGWMFRETSRTGNQHVIDASVALNDAYVFPAQAARTAHLGYQLGWLEPGDRAARMAAAAKAEGLTVSPTLDPALERKPLGDLVDAWNDGRRANADVSNLAAEIAAHLRPELERRWKLVEAAYFHLAACGRPVNEGVGGLVDEARDEFWYQHQRVELKHNDPSLGPAYVPHPETDFHGSSAASRYLIHAAADEAYIGRLIHYDSELLLEALSDGRALVGRVSGVTDIGEGRATRPVWLVDLDPSLPNRLRENGRLVPYGSPKHEASITEILVGPDSLTLELEWTGNKTREVAQGPGLKPADTAWLGEEICLVTSDAAQLTKRRSSRVWKAKDGPGAWLTHGRAPVQVEISPDDGGTDLLVDDVRQIEEGAGA
jgi:hypothetical protein